MRNAKPILLRLTLAERRAVESAARKWKVSRGEAVRRALRMAKILPQEEEGV